jgi:hypothetical protein
VRTAEDVEHDDTVLEFRFTYPVEKMHPQYKPGRRDDVR